MNSSAEFSEMGNRYLGMRHGHSLANREGIIVSDQQRGVAHYGLSDEGRMQVEQALDDDSALDSTVRIISSDFRRTRETAEIVHRLLNCGSPVEFDTRLRERWFGDLDNGPDIAYGDVWQADLADPDGEFRGVESANRVMARTTALIGELESRYRQATLLLISHGDAMQILQTAFAGRCASQHRQLPPLQTAEIRPLNRYTATFPSR